MEYVLGSLVPFIVGPKLLGPRMHLLSVLMLIEVRVYKNLSAHSGYLFPWEVFEYLPGVTNSEFHSYHHSHNDGNYGSLLVLWDRVFGTESNYRERKVKDNYGVIGRKDRHKY